MFSKGYAGQVGSRLLPRWDRRDSPAEDGDPPVPSTPDRPLQPPPAGLGDAPGPTQQPGCFNSVFQGRQADGTGSPQGGSEGCMETNYSPRWESSRKSVTDRAANNTRCNKRSRGFNQRNTELLSSERRKQRQQGD